MQQLFYNPDDELINAVREFGFHRGTQVYWLIKFIERPENKHKSRRELAEQVTGALKIPKLSKATFYRVYASYSKFLKVNRM